MPEYKVADYRARQPIATHLARSSQDRHKAHADCLHLNPDRHTLAHNLSDADFLALYEDHIKSVSTAMGVRYKLDQSLVDEIAQHARMKLISLPAEYRVDAPCVRTCANNAARDALRVIRRQAAREPVGLGCHIEGRATRFKPGDRNEPSYMPPALAQSNGPNPDSSVYVAQCLEALSDDTERRVIELYAGLRDGAKPITSIRHIAAECGISESRAKGVLRAAIAKLQRVMAPRSHSPYPTTSPDPHLP